MHALVVFVIFLGILAVLGIYMIKEPPYLGADRTENV